MKIYAVEHLQQNGKPYKRRGISQTNGLISAARNPRRRAKYMKYLRDNGIKCRLITFVEESNNESKSD